MTEHQDALQVAAFLVQALDLNETPEEIAREVVTLKRDANAGIYTVQLESSVGAAAFLVYVYALDIEDTVGRNGRALFDADLATLETAAARDAPGPRIVAHAVTDRQAFILATTPATYRALSGEATAEAVTATPADLLPTGDPAETRRTAASELFRLLHEADRQAATWLAAIRAESGVAPEAAGAAETLLFNDEETALALFLLDERSIQHLLTTLNLLLDAARRHAANALGGSPRE